MVPTARKMISDPEIPPAPKYCPVCRDDLEDKEFDRVTGINVVGWIVCTSCHLEFLILWQKEREDGKKTAS